jgi:hypothetical protein
MRRLLGFTLAAVAAAVAGLLARRLLVQGAAPASLSSGKDLAGSLAEQSGPEDTVSLKAVSLASRSLPGTRQELYEQATRLGVRGRSRMNKRQLQQALDAARFGGDV